jgi:hypothetical protein
MKPEDSSFNINNIRFSSPHRGISLKKEDKILLTIGGVFLFGVFVFLISTNTLFNFFGSPHNSPIQKALAEREQAEIDMDKKFQESAIQFQKDAERFEKKREDMRKNGDRDFQQAVDNFHERFEQAKKNFKL